MAMDKAVDSGKLGRSLNYTADRIRIKLGGTTSLIPFDYEDEKGFGDTIDGITPGGADVSGVTAEPSDVLPGKIYVSSIGVETEGQMPVLGEQIIMPSTSDRTLLSGRYLSGNQRILGDPDLIPNNIAAGKEIFNIPGACVRYGHKAEAVNIYNHPSVDYIKYNYLNGSDVSEWQSLLVDNIGFTPTHASMWCWNGLVSKYVRTVITFQGAWCIGDGGIQYKLVGTAAGNPSRFDSGRVTLPIPPAWDTIADNTVYYTITGYYE